MAPIGQSDIRDPQAEAEAETAANAEADILVERQTAGKQAGRDRLLGS